MDVGFKTWALLVELAGELEVIDDLLVEDFARDQQWNTGRIRRDQTHRDAAFQVVDFHPLGLAVGNVGVGVRGAHGRSQIRQIHVGGQTGNVVLGVHLVHMLAQITQAHSLVPWVLLAKLRHDFPHGLVLGIFILELLQSRQQRVPAAFGDANGEHDEEAVKTRLFNHHAVLGQKLADDRGGDACLVKLAVQVEARCHDGRLDRVQHVEAIGQLLTKAMPLAGLLAGIVAQYPVIGAANAFFGKFFRAPDLEPPVFAVLGIHLAHGTAKIQRFGNAFLHQCSATWRLHHGSSHVAAGNDAVLG